MYSISAAVHSNYTIPHIPMEEIAWKQVCGVVESCAVDNFANADCR